MSKARRRNDLSRRPSRDGGSFHHCPSEIPAGVVRGQLYRLRARHVPWLPVGVAIDVRPEIALEHYLAATGAAPAYVPFAQVHE